MDEIHFIFSRFRHAWHLGFGGCCCSTASLDPVAFLAQDRIDQTTLNAALFFTVKPSELRLLSVLGSGGYANVYKAVPCRFFSGPHWFFIGGKARQMAVQMRRIWMDGACYYVDDGNWIVFLFSLLTPKWPNFSGGWRNGRWVY